MLNGNRIFPSYCVGHITNPEAIIPEDKATQNLYVMGDYTMNHKINATKLFLVDPLESIWNIFLTTASVMQCILEVTMKC